jgi:hypothetical protein
VDSYHDVGQRWSEMMQHAGVKIEMLMPTQCLKPLWKLPNGKEYGIGTTFESAGGAQTFHMFGVGNSTFDDPKFTPEERLRLLEQEAQRVCTGKANEC